MFIKEMERMKYSIIVIVAALILLGSCGKKCNISNPYSYSLDTSLTAYFGMYKTGSYWVYQNQNQTQNDSIYVTSYSRSFILSRPDCEADETLLLTLRSTKNNLIVSDSVCMVAYYNQLLTQNCASSNFLYSGLTIIDFYPDSISTNNTSAILSTVTLNKQIYNGSIFAIYGPDTLYAQKQLGVIGWIKNGQTFNLVKHYLHP